MTVANRPVYQSYKNRADLKYHIMMGKAVKTHIAFLTAFTCIRQVRYPTTQIGVEKVKVCLRQSVSKSSSPNSVFCRQANHSRVKSAGSFDVERFMHEPGSGVSVKQHSQAVFISFIIGGGERLHHDAHQPGHIVTDIMGPPMPSPACCPFEEVGIVLLQTKRRVF